MNDQNRIKRAAALLDRAIDLAFGEQPTLEIRIQAMHIVKEAREGLSEPTDAEVLQRVPWA